MTGDANRAYEPFLEVPTPEQEASLRELSARAETLERGMEQVPPEFGEERAAFVRDIAARAGIRWTLPEVVDATSSDARVSLAIQPDRSIHRT